VSKKIVTPELAGEISRLREEVDGWGDKKWSCAAIAEKLGLSESTVWRVDTRRAAYAGKNRVGDAKRAEARWAALLDGTLPLETTSVDDAAVAASLAKLTGMLEQKSEPSKFITPEMLERKRQLIGGE
jgi:IS30 family transposase